jgi:uroporphyrinogen-III synthase
MVIMVKRPFRRESGVRTRKGREQNLGPLSGFAVAIAADRRRHGLATILEASGAKTVCVQAVRPIAQADERAVATATRMALTAPADEVIISSAFGLRAWMRVVRASALVKPVLAMLDGARLLAGDNRAADEMRDLGLTQIWSTFEHDIEDLFRYLVAQPLAGRRIVMQLDQESQRELARILELRGADVVLVATSQSAPPPHMDIVRRLSDAVKRRAVDAIAFTSAAAARSLFAQADVDGTLAEVVSTLDSDVQPFCLGHLTTAVLAEHGVEPAVPEFPDCASCRPQSPLASSAAVGASEHTDVSSRSAVKPS